MPIKKRSPYAILNSWLCDGSDNTVLAEDILNSPISQLYILHYFQTSKYITYVSNVFNNYGLFSLSKLSVFKQIKDIVKKSGYKPPFVPKIKSDKNKLEKYLYRKYAFLKREEIYMMIEEIDSSENKDQIYETAGIYKKSTKKKSTVAQKAKLKKIEKTKIDDTKEYNEFSF